MQKWSSGQDVEEQTGSGVPGRKWFRVCGLVSGNAVTSVETSDAAEMKPEHPKWLHGVSVGNHGNNINDCTYTWTRSTHSPVLSPRPSAEPSEHIRLSLSVSTSAAERKGHMGRSHGVVSQ